MAEEKKNKPEDLTVEPADFEVEELSENELEGAAGGFEDSNSFDSNSGCTVNNAAGC
jgi:hypothetical protein